MSDYTLDKLTSDVAGLIATAGQQEAFIVGHDWGGIVGWWLAAKQTTKKTTGRSNSSSKRELIDTGSDKRFVRRDSHGQFKEVDDVGRSLSQDRKRKAKTTVKSGHGDKGDQKRRK